MIRLLRKDGSPFQINQKPPKPSLLRSVAGVFTVERVVAFLAGMASVLGFLATPLKDPILEVFYGLEIDLTLRSATRVDPDKGPYSPELFLGAKTLATIPSGVITLDAESKSAELMLEKEQYTQKFESFRGAQHIVGPSLEVDRILSEGQILMSVSLVSGSKSDIIAKEKFLIEFVREPSRNFVVSHNFTGRWSVEFPEPTPPGSIEVRHLPNGKLTGILRLETPIFNEIDGDIPLSGYVDGTSFVLSAHVGLPGQLILKDIVVDHSIEGDRYVLNGNLGIFDHQWEAIEDFQPIPIKLSAHRLRSATSAK